MKINFNYPNVTHHELFNIKKILKGNNFINSGKFYNDCSTLIKKKFSATNVFLTNNCTSAIEAALLSVNLKKKDEVIIQSYNFVSIVDILCKLSINFKFCDINKFFVMDLNDLKNKINKNTRVIILTHYNGNSVDFSELKKIIKNKNILIIEDAAQVYGSKYKNNLLGSYGDFSAFSFHQTKNLHCGSGGALILNNTKYLNNLKNVLDRGTNKSEFLNSKASKYTWVSKGVSSSITEMQSAFLLNQLKNEKKITTKRKKLFNLYKFYLKDLNSKRITSSFQRENTSNYHMFYILLKNLAERNKFIMYMKRKRIEVTSHYEPLHLSKFYKKNFKKNLKLPTTEVMSKKIVRLPLHLKLNSKEIKFISSEIISFFNK